MNVYFLTENTIKQVVKVLSHLDNCPTVWSNKNKTYLALETRAK